MTDIDINLFSSGTIDVQTHIDLPEGVMRIDHELREAVDFLVLNFWADSGEQYQNLDVLNDMGD